MSHALTQLDPPVPVYILKTETEAGNHRSWPGGEGYAVALIDYGQEYTTLWKVIFDDGGEIWDIPQSHVRGQRNASMERHT